jgi:hypothetical protein
VVFSPFDVEGKLTRKEIKIGAQKWLTISFNYRTAIDNCWDNDVTTVPDTFTRRNVSVYYVSHHVHTRE